MLFNSTEFLFVFLPVLPIVFLAPNTQQIMQGFQPALAMSVVLALGLLSLTRPSEFLYFQF